ERATDAQAVLTEVKSVLSNDELALPLEPKLADLASRALAILQRVAPKPEPVPQPKPQPEPPPAPPAGTKTLVWKDLSAMELEARVKQLKNELPKEGRFTVTLEIRPVESDA
ncbi:MAG TPA: hypothetical protein V6D47_13260, partial [Oscillatoriaceae cyanobacterium]